MVCVGEASAYATVRVVSDPEDVSGDAAVTVDCFGSVPAVCEEHAPRTAVRDSPVASRPSVRRSMMAFRRGCGDGYDDGRVR
jgi:hypothetical protein